MILVKIRSFNDAKYQVEHSWLKKMVVESYQYAYSN